MNQAEFKTVWFPVEPLRRPYKPHHTASGGAGINLFSVHERTDTRVPGELQ